VSAVEASEGLAKRAAGERAASYVESGMRVGLGTGSTVRFTTEALGRMGLDIVCTATSDDTEKLAREVGLRVEDPDALRALDIAIDGADEIDPRFNLTKGGGGALTREKLVGQMSRRFIVVADESKLVEQLGPFGTPLEVLRFAPDVVADRVRALGARDVTRRDRLSDNGCVLMDAHFGVIDDPASLARSLEAVPGIIEHGLFLADMVERVVVGTPDGSTSELVRET
jgi:ribose 5-phosphate isomerase A